VHIILLYNFIFYKIDITTIKPVAKPEFTNGPGGYPKSPLGYFTDYN